MQLRANLNPLLPTFFVIGAAKSGTTSLYRYLGLHPEIHVPPLKEPNYFCRVEDGPWTFRVWTRAEYEALFRSEEPVRGDCSTSYSQHPLRSGVPERIHELVPDARFIYLVRDPVERAVAHYMQLTSSSLGRWNSSERWPAEPAESRPLRKALDSVDDPTRNPYLAASLYATQVERYRDVFPAERMLVIDSDDLRANRGPTLARIFRFLNVDQTVSSPGFSEEFNPTGDKRRYPRRYNRLRQTGLGMAWRHLPERWRVPVARRVREAVMSPAKQPTLDDDLRLALEDVFRPDVDRLRKLTGQAFSNWSL